MSPPGPRKQSLQLKAYRIVKRKFVNVAFSGEGARRYGGRWNSAGVPVVYTSSTIALALLEWRAHLTQWPAPPVMIIEIRFDPGLVLTATKLPPNWKQLPAPKAAAGFGDNWVRSGRSAILKVPSTIVTEEFNYLLNPAHAQFGRIKIGKPHLLEVNPRIGPLTIPTKGGRR